MLSYRIYFRGRGGIMGREDFPADDDPAAVDLADLLWDACRDTADAGYELWHGDRLVERHAERARLLADAASISQRMQEALVRTEKSIAQSRWAIADSRRLLEQLDRARRLR